MDIPASARRVEINTSEESNRRIEMMTFCHVEYYAAHRDEIGQRLVELDEEWDIERVLEANASTLALGALALGLVVNKKILAVTGLILGFLCQHAIQGWCPPLPLLRRMGVRTRTEIERERYALKVLRGDFAEVAGGETKDVEQVMSSVLE